MRLRLTRSPAGLLVAYAIGMGLVAGCGDDNHTSPPDAAPDATPDATPGVTITTDAPSYTLDQTITVSYSGFPGATGEYVTIAAGDAPLTSFRAQQNTIGTNGSLSFTAVQIGAGTYVARAFSSAAVLLATSASFTISNTNASMATVTTDATCYVTGSGVTVSFTKLPGNVMDRIAVGSPTDPAIVTQEQFTGGDTSGSLLFFGLPADSYRARAFVAGSELVLGTSDVFTIKTSCP